MEIFKYIAKSIKIVPQAFILAPMAFLIGSFGEGFQHFIELNLGMFETHDAFAAHAASMERLASGAVKVISIFAAVYMSSAALTQKYGQLPQGITFRRRFLESAWKPQSGWVNLVLPVVLIAPLFWLHFKLNGYAIGHDHTAWVLALDSLVVGVLSLVMGVAMWATEFQG